MGRHRHVPEESGAPEAGDRAGEVTAGVGEGDVGPESGTGPRRFRHRVEVPANLRPAEARLARPRSGDEDDCACTCCTRQSRSQTSRASTARCCPERRSCQRLLRTSRSLFHPQERFRCRRRLKLTPCRRLVASCRCVAAGEPALGERRAGVPVPWWVRCVVRWRTGESGVNQVSYPVACLGGRAGPRVQQVCDALRCSCGLFS